MVRKGQTTNRDRKKKIKKSMRENSIYSKKHVRIKSNLLTKTNKNNKDLNTNKK